MNKERPTTCPSCEELRERIAELEREVETLRYTIKLVTNFFDKWDEERACESERQKRRLDRNVYG